MKLLMLLLAAPAIASAQTPAPAPAPATKLVVDKQDKVICRSTSEIGSLVATNKVCRTRREWDRLRDDLRERGPVGNCGAGAGVSCN